MECILNILYHRSLPLSFQAWCAVENHKRTKLLSEIGGNTAISIAYNEIREQRKDGRTSDDMHIFNFQTILEATAHFSSTNKIREGGFGPVYKVMLLLLLIIFSFC